MWSKIEFLKLFESKFEMESFLEENRFRKLLIGSAETDFEKKLLNDFIQARNRDFASLLTLKRTNTLSWFSSFENTGAPYAFEKTRKLMRILGLNFSVQLVSPPRTDGKEQYFYNLILSN